MVITNAKDKVTYFFKGEKVLANMLIENNIIDNLKYNTNLSKLAIKLMIIFNAFCDFVKVAFLMFSFFAGVFFLAKFNDVFFHDVV